jgi:diguanylate cyclase (GGDEF)-like protein
MRTEFGDPRTIEEHIVKLDDGVLIVARDATARKNLDAQAIKNGLRDPLTGLHNRVQLFERIEAAMAMAHRTGRMVGLIFIDIDNFKEVNDSEGHDLGDAILIAVANRLAGAVRQTDMVFRYGGDEMVVLAPGILYSGDLAVLANRLSQALATPIEMSDGREFPVTLSMGGAVSPDDAKDPAALLRCADQAMYHSKGTGRNGFTLFEALRSEDVEQAPAAVPHPRRR